MTRYNYVIFVEKRRIKNALGKYENPELYFLTDLVGY